MNGARMAVPVLGLALVAGCLGSKPFVGVVGPGAPTGVYDFTFSGPDNRQHQFSEVAYGSVSVLGMVDESSGEEVEEAKRLDALAEKHVYDGLEVFLVAHSNPDTTRKDICIVTRSYEPKRLYLLCDGQRKVADAYGVTEKVEYIVVDQNARIVGRTSDWGRLTRLVAQALEGYRAKAGKWVERIY